MRTGQSVGGLQASYPGCLVGPRPCLGTHTQSARRVDTHRNARPYGIEAQRRVSCARGDDGGLFGGRPCALRRPCAPWTRIHGTGGPGRRGWRLRTWLWHRVGQMQGVRNARPRQRGKTFVENEAVFTRGAGAGAGAPAMAGSTGTAHGNHGPVAIPAAVASSGRRHGRPPRNEIEPGLPWTAHGLRHARAIRELLRCRA